MIQERFQEAKSNSKIAEILKLELEKKQMHNPRFSLRAYARLIGIPVGSLSQIMSGKRGLSLKNAIKVADAFEYSSTQRRKFMELAVRGFESELSLNEIPQVEFQKMSDWYYFAILSLWQLSDCQDSPGWVAKKLGISVFEATNAIQRLIQLKLIELKDGKISVTTAPVRFTADRSTVDTRKYHAQMIQKSLNALETVNHSERLFASRTFAINYSDLPRLRQRISEVLDEFSDPKTPRSQDAVYAMNVQLFPLTTTSNEGIK